MDAAQQAREQAEVADAFRKGITALRDFIAQHPATVGSEVEGHVMHLLLEKQMTRFGQLYLLARP